MEKGKAKGKQARDDLIDGDGDGVADMIAAELRKQ